MLFWKDPSPRELRGLISKQPLYIAQAAATSHWQKHNKWQTKTVMEGGTIKRGGRGGCSDDLTLSARFHVHLSMRRPRPNVWKALLQYGSPAELQCIHSFCARACVFVRVCDAMCWRQAHIRVHTVELSPLGVESLKKEIPPGCLVHAHTHTYTHLLVLHPCPSPSGTSLMKPMLVCLRHMQFSWLNTTSVFVCVFQGKRHLPLSHDNVFSWRSQRRDNTAALPSLSPSVKCRKDISRTGF